MNIVANMPTNLKTLLSFIFGLSLFAFMFFGNSVSMLDLIRQSQALPNPIQFIRTLGNIWNGLSNLWHDNVDLYMYSRILQTTNGVQENANFLYGLWQIISVLVNIIFIPIALIAGLLLTGVYTIAWVIASFCLALSALTGTESSVFAGVYKFMNDIESFGVYLNYGGAL